MTALKLGSIRLDGGTQPRAAIDRAVVEEYASSMREGDLFPPLTVFYDGKDYWLADGFHRYEAAQAAGKTEIDCDVKQGTRRDAILHSVGVNADHGFRRTNEDKRRAVETLLRDAEWVKWSDREIGRQCRVSDWLVRSLRGTRSEPTEAPAKVERIYKNKHGGILTMKTGKIGRKKQEPVLDEPELPGLPPLQGLREIEKLWAQTPEQGRLAIIEAFKILIADPYTIEHIITLTEKLIGTEQEKFKWQRPPFQRLQFPHQKKAKPTK